MARLEIRLFGAFEVVLNKRTTISFESEKVRALLAYLVVENRHAHRRIQLARLFWPDSPEKRARQNLSQALYNLRTSLGDREAEAPFLTISPQNILFEHASDYWSDLGEFEMRISVCADHVHRQVVTCSWCHEQLKGAVEIYRGAFLANLSLKDNSNFAEWAMVLRENLHRKAINTIQKLAKYDELCGDYEHALGYAHQRVDLEPWRESAHRQLMRLLAISGQRSAALEQYQVCCQILADELGVKPQDKTTELCNSIRDGEDASHLVVHPIHNLPAHLTPFIGRERELTQIRAWLNDPSYRLLTLVGPGGCGKSRLALEAVRTELSNFPDGVFLISLAHLRSADAIVPAIGKVLDFSFRKQGAPQQQLMDYLRRKTMLLILDNFEHVLDGVNWVLTLLRTAPSVTMMVTSRSCLNIKGEILFNVDGLDFPDLDEVTGLSLEELVNQFSSIKLYRCIAERIQPSFSLTDEQIVDVARICNKVQGMPLAILLAAAWVGTYSPSEIADQIEQGYGFLETNWCDLPVRQRSMRVVLDHSWNLLNPEEQKIIIGLSVFQGGFNRHAAEQIVGVSPQNLQCLVNKTFLQPNSDGRFEIHELTRQFLADKLVQSPEFEKSIREQHSGFYMLFLEQCGVDFKGPRQQKALQDMDLELENVCTAWRWAINCLWGNRVEMAIEALGLYYDFRVRYREGASIYQDAIEGLSSNDTRILHIKIKIKIWLAHFKSKLENREEALQLYSDCWLELIELEKEGMQVRPEQALTLLGMGRIIFRSTNESAKKLFEESLEIYQLIPDHWWEAVALNALGNVAVASSNYLDAKQYFEKSYKIRQGLGDKRCMASSLQGMSVNAQYLGNLADSEMLVREANQILREMGIQSGLVSGQRRLADIFAWQGHYEESKALFEKTLKDCEIFGLKYDAVNSWIMLGALEMFSGRYARANTLVRKGIFMAQQHGFTREQGLALFILGGVALAEQKNQKAEYYLSDSFRIFHDLNAREELSWVIYLMSYTAHKLGRVGQAWQIAYDGLQISAENGTFMSRLIGVSMISYLYSKREGLEMAIELNALVMNISFVRKSRWFKDMIGKQIIKATSKLPPDTIAASEMRGRNRNWDETIQILLKEFKRGELTGDLPQ